MEDLNFNDDAYPRESLRSAISPSSRRVTKAKKGTVASPPKWRDIEQILERKRLEKALQDVFSID